MVSRLFAGNRHKSAAFISCASTDAAKGMIAFPGAEGDGPSRSLLVIRQPASLQTASLQTAD
jgi:hypothetical protein